MFTVTGNDFNNDTKFNTLPECIDHVLYLCASGNYWVYLDKVLFAKIENYTDYEFDMILYFNNGQNNVPYYRLKNKPD